VFIQFGVQFCGLQNCLPSSITSVLPPSPSPSLLLLVVVYACCCCIRAVGLCISIQQKSKSGEERFSVYIAAFNHIEDGSEIDRLLSVRVIAVDTVCMHWGLYVVSYIVKCTVLGRCWS